MLLRIFLTLVFIVFCFPAFSQVSPEDVIFLEKIIREKKKDGSIVYTNHLNANDTYKILLKLRKAPFQPTDVVDVNTVKLTKQERKEIEIRFELYTKPFWIPGLFQDSKIIEEQKTFNYFKSVYNEYSEALTDPRATQQDRSQMMNNAPQPLVFEFSPPIYLKKNNVCMVYIKTVCGSSCGTSELIFYKKLNDQFEKWVTYDVD